MKTPNELDHGADHAAAYATALTRRLQNIAPDPNIVLAAATIATAIGELVEATRALKPEPEARVYTTAAGPLSVGFSKHTEAKLLERIEQLTTQCDEAQNGYNDHVRLSNELHAEAERLRAENADLRATAARIAKSNGEIAEENERLRGVPGVGDAMAAELRRFRERERLVEAMIEASLDVTSDTDVPGNGLLRDTTAVVRDFKLT